MAQVPTPELIEYFLAHLDDNKKNEIIAVYVPCLFFAYTAVILRFVSRRLIKTSYQWDDWTIVIGLVCFNPRNYILDISNTKRGNSSLHRPLPIQHAL